jgi:hypothetical protein
LGFAVRRVIEEKKERTESYGNERILGWRLARITTFGYWHTLAYIGAHYW